MYFNRTPVKVLPDGSLSTVFPFHVYTEGLEDNHHVRNTICYIIRNSLDLGQMIDRYEWNSFMSLFCDGKIAAGTTAISALSYREKRNLLNVSSIRGDGGRTPQMEDSRSIDPHNRRSLYEKIFQTLVRSHLWREDSDNQSGLVLTQGVGGAAGKVLIPQERNGLQDIALGQSCR